MTAFLGFNGSPAAAAGELSRYAAPPCTLCASLEDRSPLWHATLPELTNGEIGNIAYEYGAETAAVGPNKISRCTNLVEAVESKCEVEGHDQPLVDLIETVVRSLTPWHVESSVEFAGFLAALRIDGLDVLQGRLVPTTPEPAALAPQISLLEEQLEGLGLSVARRHYRQACDNLAEGNFEAANGQLRSYLEDLFVGVCARVAGKTFGDPGGALQHLRDTGHLDPKEWATFRGFWDASQTNGPHPGLSNSHEALYRVHVGTAVGRYLIAKFP